MKQIWFKQKFYNPILTGQKTQTIRLWKKNPKFIIGQEFECFFGFKHNKLKGIIRSVIIKTFDNITEKEVKLDGYESKSVLYNNLKEYYTDFTNQKNLYLIRFNIL